MKMHFCTPHTSTPLIFNSNQSEMDHEGKLQKSQGPAPSLRLMIIICNLNFPTSGRNEVILIAMAEMSPQLLMQDLHPVFFEVSPQDT